MQDQTDNTAAEGNTPQRLFVYNGGFLTQRRVRRILSLSGYNVRFGRPSAKEPGGDLIGAWGKSPTAHRAEAAAKKHDLPLLRVEDSFLRSVLPGRSGSAPIGLNIDTRGVHFDSKATSDLEQILATHPLDDTALLDRARHASARIQAAHLSKYTCFDPIAPVPDPGYVLVIDQTRGDASIAHGGATAASFREMLVFAQLEHPGQRIVIKTHPETRLGHRDGHFGPDDANDRISLVDGPVSPWALLEGAIAVYTVTSQLGFEAINAGHKPRVFGQPFYGGWGLTQDENPVARRTRRLTRAQLFAGAMILYPTWYDPCRDALCPLEDAISALEAETRAWREDHAGYVALGMSLWKRKPLQAFYGATRPLQFARSVEDVVARARTEDRAVMVWAGGETEALQAATQAANLPLIRVEDGFLRSRGLGAELTPPLSLVADDLGIYYDPARPSRLEKLIAARATLPADAEARALRLIASVRRAGLSKYNLTYSDWQGVFDSDNPEKPARILVPGQVEDDASILKGTGNLRSNLDLLKATRDANPDAFIIYKPHPDVEAGLRKGQVSSADALTYADVIADKSNPVALIDTVDSVWTLTSLLGFEALIRHRNVTCLGMPFYAGWGLTDDHLETPPGRGLSISLAGLVHAVLIDYPRYFDPLTARPCPVEVVVERLASGATARRGPFNRSLSKLQGLFAGFAPLWR